MKKNYILIATFVLFFFIGTNNMFSQFTQFKAKAGLQTALNQAKIDLKDPELYFLGTQAGTIKATVTIDNVFDISKGVATVWAYMFRSISKPDSQKFYGVAFALGSYIAQSIDPTLLNGKLPFTPVDALASQTWFDSDILAQDITKNADYQAFLIKYNDAKLQLAGLAIEPGVNIIYWIANISGAKSSMNCKVNTTTGETVCIDVTPVTDPVQSVFEIYPNPATSSAVISIPSDNNTFRIELYNTLGEKLTSISSDAIPQTNQVMLDLNSFADGLYYINYISGGINSVKPLIIKR